MVGIANCTVPALAGPMSRLAPERRVASRAPAIPSGREVEGADTARCVAVHPPLRFIPRGRPARNPKPGGPVAAILRVRRRPGLRWELRAVRCARAAWHRGRPSSEVNAVLPVSERLEGDPFRSERARCAPVAEAPTSSEPTGRAPEEEQPRREASRALPPDPGRRSRSRTPSGSWELKLLVVPLDPSLRPPFTLTSLGGQLPATSPL